MNKRFIWISIICLALLITPIVPVSIANAETSSPRTYDLSFIDSNTSLSGISTAKNQYFNIDPNWNVNEVVFHLDYQATPLTDDNRSSVTLSINGTDFHAFRPIKADLTKQRLTIIIPNELIIKGTNTLSVRGNIQLPNDNLICITDNTRENWLQLYNTSGITIHYTNAPLEPSIREFNRLFTSIDTIADHKNAIAVSEQSSSQELEAAIYALSGFAKANPLKSRTTIPLFTSNKDMSDKQAVVMIALYDHLPATYKGLLGTPDLNNKALIQLVNANTQPTLVITSNDPNLLVKAGRFVANQELMGQIDSDKKIIDDNTDVTTRMVNMNQNIVLTENGEELRGPWRQERSFFIALPASRTIADSSKIKLDFRYAKNLDFDRSMVTIYVNNTPIGSKKLTPEFADGDSLTLPIPKNLNVAGNFSVSVAFDLEMTGTGCIDYQNEMPWAFITKDSLIQLNTKDQTNLLFNNYPYPFMRDGNYSQVAVVMPAERDQYTYLTLTNLFNLLGQFAEGNTGNVNFFEDNVGSDALQGRSIIAIGSYQNNKVIQANNDKLFFQYAPNGTEFQSNEKMSIDPSYGKRIGTLQLIESPYSPGNGLLAVTGAGSEYYYLASKLIASSSSIWQIYGDAAVTDKDGTIQSFRFKKQAGEEQVSPIKDILQNKNTLVFLVTFSLILILVLVSLILILRKYRMKRRNK
ncbi:cellulose synthase [Paenibacillus albiflavus]|uniref:Cellulose synthase n=1 Tax=Paenibacillus albiflavus TaxID=2545760 RepID=A0A4R4EC30_9BACL|nr:cellulose biosynthesis cyclic di-GMP-binding regulatory protein BcsB [Paenibacillus albiflavus]TCZ75701.1 cellulose synthase [Paenibacillus albiflavus]